MAKGSAELPGRLLVLDDEPLIRRAWARWCGSRGIAITTASTPDQVREALEREPPFDLVLCDFQLEQGGRALTSKALVEELCAARLPAVVVTGDVDRARAALAGVAAVVLKQADLDRVVTTALRAVARR